MRDYSNNICREWIEKRIKSNIWFNKSCKDKESKEWKHNKY